MGGGYTYLNKKAEHPEKFDNIKKVWLKEEEFEEKKRKNELKKKKIQEEKELYEFKKIQVEKGIIPQSELDKIDFLYNENIEDNKNINEEYLLGKAIKEIPKNKRMLINENEAFDKNEDFIKTHEDPVYYLKLESLKKNLNQNSKKIKKTNEKDYINNLIKSKIGNCKYDNVNHKIYYKNKNNKIKNYNNKEIEEIKIQNDNIKSKKNEILEKIKKFEDKQKVSNYKGLNNFYKEAYLKDPNLKRNLDNKNLNKNNLI